MATTTAQTDCDLEVRQKSKVQQPLPMNPDLFKALTSYDKKTLDELLGLQVISASSSVGEIAITVPEDAAAQKDTSCCLLGVTPERNTALHIVASLGHLELAKEICQREISLLAAQNARLDTPMHCAARAGDHKMVSLLIKFAREGGIETTTVLKATNWEQNNALHEAAKYGHTRVAEALLMQEDAGLTCMLNGAGMSPLYLAIVTGSLGVAKALLQSSLEVRASPAFYAGPDQKTALHAAVFCPAITQDLLEQTPTAAKDVDFSGRIPLHYAASDGHHHMVKLLLDRDRSTAYISDLDGSFPIHIAASMGNIDIVDQILQQCSDTEELLDKDGKNFLHVAVQRKRLNLVKRIIGKRPHLRKLLNDQDKKGNTPLHTAVENEDEWMVYYLAQHKSIYLNIMNHNGSNPLDMAHPMSDEGFHFRMNAKHRIVTCLASAKASLGPQVLDDLKRLESSSDDKVKEQSSSSEDKEIEKELEHSKNAGIISVLIATLTFAAGFTLPGGYVADDHSGRGTAVLAKEYPFKVFLISDAFALVCSILATWWLIFAGTAAVDKSTRRRLRSWAALCVELALVGVSTAFAMGIYVVLPFSCKRLGILLCFMAVGAPFLALIVTWWNDVCSSNTVRARQGCRHWILPTAHPLVSHRLHPRLLPAALIFRLPLCTVGINALYFLLAML